MADLKYLIGDKVTVAVAVNGRVRDQLEISSEDLSGEKEVLSRVKKLPKIKDRISGKIIIREIYVPGKMVNLVVK